MQINQAQFDKVVAEALSKVVSVPNAKRWTNAINKAANEIQGNPFVELLPDNSLLLLSSTSNILYELNSSSCGCVAAQYNQPCKHAAAKRLLKNYLKQSTQ